MRAWQLAALALAAVTFSAAAAADQDQALLQALQLTPAQQKEVQCLARHKANACPAVKLTAQQKAELHKVAPDLKITPQLIDRLRAIVLDRSRSIGERVKAMEKLTGIHPKHPIHLNICIWDIVGRDGPIFTAAENERPRLLSYGIAAHMIEYTSESVMVQALKAGRCDAALMSGLRARLFDKYTGTIDSIGGLESLRQMHLLLRVLSSPKVADKMVSGDYDVLGIAPAGGAYLFVDNKKIDSLAKAAGKKVAVLNYDKTQAQMVAQVGATPVPTNFVHAPNLFNNHAIDVLPAPLVAYEALELYKGMQPNGGIIQLPIAELTMQLIGRRAKIPNLAAQLVREAFFENYGRIVSRLHQETSRIPKHWWIPIPAADKHHYEQLMRQARIHLRNKGYYSGSMLELERRVACHYHPSRAECTAPGPDNN